jgi:AraC-like DNA-binding protein
LRDSLYDQETGELLSKYAAEYDNDTLRKENEGHRSMLRLYLILFIAALVLVAILWLSYRRRQQRRIRELMDQLAKSEESESEVRGYEGAEVCGYENQRSAPTGKANSHEAQDGNLALSSPRTPTPTKEAPDTNNPISAEDRAFLIRVIEVVNTNLATCQFDIDSVAEEMGMSRSTFRRRMLAASGSTPKAYITAIQMRRASNLLKRHPDMLITEVSAQCGFEDTSSFNRAFKRAFGVSPSQFRSNA